MKTSIIEKRVQRDDVFYTIYWSRLKKIDRFEITRAVPAVSGIFELYYQDATKKLILFARSQAWYGGLRSCIREKTDTELAENPKIKDILENRTCYYRYAATDSYNDLMDILYFFEIAGKPPRKPVEHSGRYQNISVTEMSEDKIVTL